MQGLEALSRQVLKEIRAGKIKSKAQLNKRKNKLCREKSLKEIPTNTDILGFAEKRDRKLLALLLKKPVRSLSGVVVVAVMSKPHQCPGNCLYCPQSLVEAEVPKSYTGKEPATMRGLSAKFDAYQQAIDRLRQLQEVGHSTSKIELIVMGGTFPSTSFPYQKKFVKGCLDALNEKKASSFEEAKRLAETSANRISGITFETRPDYCREKHINRMLELGGTRVELGVQTIDDKVYQKVNRGHSVAEVIEATQKLKDSAFKCCYHLMPGLPFTNIRKELKQLKSIFSNPDFKPDMLKIYPCLVVKGAELERLWRRGEFKPLGDRQAARVIAEFKSILPRWVRVMRVQRDIPAGLIEAGVKASNLRELAQEEMKRKGWRCQCIRCREAGLKAYKEKADLGKEKIKMFREDYEASNSQEIFLSAEDRKRKALFGFCRLRIPFKPFRKEINGQTALVRELHVYSSVVPVGKKAKKGEFQHTGLGKRLLQEAEGIAREEFGKKKMIVISGLGVREYYRKQGYRNDGAYVSKALNK